MNVRLTALLVVLVLGLQSFVPQPVFAHQSQAASHCSDAGDGTAVPHDPAIESTNQHGCCPADTGLMTCAGHCVLASAVVAASYSPSIADDCGGSYEALASPRLPSRFDIPPTPPPIA